MDMNLMSQENMIGLDLIHLIQVRVFLVKVDTLTINTFLAFDKSPEKNREGLY